MHSLSGIPFLRFTLAFISGILVYIFFQPAIDFFIYTFLSFSLYLLLFSFQKLKKEYSYSLKPWLGLSALATLFLFGNSITYINDEYNKPNHLLNYNKQFTSYEAVITSMPEKRAKTYKMEARISRLIEKDSFISIDSKIILYISQKGYDSSLNYGDLLLIKGTPQLVAPALNPFEFDYKNYLKYLHIYHTHYLPKGNYLRIDSGRGNQIVRFAFYLRKKADQVIHDNIQGKNEQDIASALLLGIRGTLDEELKAIYSSTGTTHVLAVSGLHVTIVFQLLLWFFFFLKSSKYSRKLLPIFLLSLLWVYVLVTGFCPSILRAGVMFSLMIIGKSINRSVNIYNILFVSSFSLLCFDPYMIMDVGFQLSYLAVIGICYFTDKIYSLIECSSWIMDKIWMSFSISLAAQITTLPITMYYFHQVPLSFLLSNLIAIPLSNGVLYLGILLLITSPLPILPPILGCLIEWIIKTLNYVLYLISQIPFNLIDKIQITLIQVGLIYLIVITGVIFIRLKKYRLFLSLFTICSIIIATFLYQSIENKNQRRAIIYSIKGHSAMAFINGTHALLITDTLLVQNTSKINRHILPSITAYGIDSFEINTNKPWLIQKTTTDFSVYLYQGKSFLLVKNPAKSLPVCDYTINAFPTNRRYKKSPFNKIFNHKDDDPSINLSFN